LKIFIPKEMKVRFQINDIYYIGKSVKVLDKVGARTSALDALEALEKLGAVQITPQKSKQLQAAENTHIIN
jgi:hypothetical protein